MHPWDTTVRLLLNWGLKHFVTISAVCFRTWNNKISHSKRWPKVSAGALATNLPVLALQQTDLLHSRELTSLSLVLGSL